MAQRAPGTVVQPGPRTTDTTPQTVPFRRAAVERVEILPSESNVVTAARIPIERNIEGSGYFFGIVLDVGATTVTNTAQVTFPEDSPWAALDSVVLRDVNGELVNVTGYDLYLHNLAAKQYAYREADMSVGAVNQAATYQQAALSPAAVAINTTAEQTFAVGLLASDIVVSIQKPTAQAGLGIVGWRNAGAGNVGITFSNNTGVAITPTAAELYIIGVAPSAHLGAPAASSGRSQGIFNMLPGPLAGGGSFNWMLRVPVAIHRRSLLGLLGNQDRAQKYSLRTDQAASTAIWTVAPTVLPTMTIAKLYENYSVPLPTSPAGAPQQMFPPGFGTIHFVTSTISESVPAPSTTVNHYLRRIGNTIRFIVVVLRAGTGTTPRTVADANAPTNLRLKIGEDTVFNETYRYRRYLMFQRYGYDFPAGILVYDAIHDLVPGAGNELGDDYWRTQALVNAQFQIAYPAGFTAGGSIKFLTDDLIYVPPSGQPNVQRTGA
jgi:hypothetical protein